MVFLFTFCEKKEDHNIFIQTNPQEPFLEATANDIMLFSIYCSSDSRLSVLEISKRTEKTTSNKIFDTNLSTKVFEMTWEYKIPEFEDTLTKVSLTFTVTDDDGYQSRTSKLITVYTPIKDEYLTETAGHVMYSHASGEFDAYNLITGNPIYADIADSINIHITDVSTDSTHGHTLSKKWISPAGMKFVRFNDYDYANATGLSLKNSYNSGNKRDFVNDLKDEDILLTKLETDSIAYYFAIKITNVIDQDSTNLDRYIFNLKK
jgi:hypothetical protein